MILRVVIIQSEMEKAQPLVKFFTQRGDEVWQAWDLGQAWAQIGQVKPHLMLMDLHFASGEWINFIRRVRQALPDTRIIMTNQFPDLQREMLARDQGVQVFLREPFSPHWVEQALKRLDGDTQPVRVRRRPVEAPAAAEGEPSKPEQTGSTPADPSAVDSTDSLPAVVVRPRARKSKKEERAPAVKPVTMPMRIKITLPYMLLVLLFALAGAYVVSRVVLESVQDRFLNQLVETGKQSTDWMVREEDRLLSTLRLVANTQSVAGALNRKDAEELRGLIMPLMVNSGDEALELLDPTGESVLSVRHKAGGGPQDYQYARGETSFRDWSFVQRVMARSVDQAGDKFAGLGSAAWGDYFYVSGPVLDANGELAGIVLVGKSLRTLVTQMQQETLGETTIYDTTGQPLASTLFIGSQDYPLEAAQVSSALRSAETSAHTRDLKVSSIGYTEILGPWEARGGDQQGILGVSLVQAFLVRTSQVTQVEIFVIVAAGILLVLLVGLYLANIITRPLLRLVKASREVAKGNLEIKVDASGNDEVAVLAQSFNQMVAGLQEGSIYRDLLGRTVSPEVREQLRQTFSSGNLHLEGQEAVATVLFTDIRGFTPISEQADPAIVFQWLNEYFSAIVPIVATYGGVVNKFDGDAMLAFFGILPKMLSPKQSALAACQCAVEVLEAINRLNRQRAMRGDPPLVTGIGVNTGVVMAGGLGTSDRLHYTIIGDTVNTTQRIEALTREVIDCSGVLISKSTFTALGSSQVRFEWDPMGDHSVKGKAEPIFIYRLTAMNEKPKGM